MHDEPGYWMSEGTQYHLLRVRDQLRLLATLFGMPMLLMISVGGDPFPTWLAALAARHVAGTVS